jgi:acyl carrier protein
MRTTAPAHQAPDDVRELTSVLLEVIVATLKFSALEREIDADTKLFGLDGLGCDSLDAFELVVALEARLAIRIGEVELYECGSVGAVAALLHARLQERATA